jgi:glutaredoxin-like YruB-family protein
VDVGAVKDVHRRLGVTMAPTVLVIQDGAVRQQLVGMHTEAEYQSALMPNNRPSPQSQAAPGTGTVHRVVVYTGAHCSWCTRVKAYLRQRNVPFTEIDVSLEPAQAQALVRKTGQTGVPQLDIDGRYVVGFDKARIDALLGLAPSPVGTGAF